MLTGKQIFDIIDAVRESNSKALLLTDAASANGEETRDVCISAAQFREGTLRSRLRAWSM
jgi:hypothetical protein